MCQYWSVSVLLAYNLWFINVHFISAFAFSWGFMFGFVQIYTSIHIHYPVFTDLFNTVDVQEY